MSEFSESDFRLRQAEFKLGDPSGAAPLSFPPEMEPQVPNPGRRPLRHEAKISRLVASCELRRCWKVYCALTHPKTYVNFEAPPLTLHGTFRPKTPPKPPKKEQRPQTKPRPRLAGTAAWDPCRGSPNVRWLQSRCLKFRFLKASKMGLAGACLVHQNPMSAPRTQEPDSMLQLQTTTLSLNPLKPFKSS